MRICRDRATHRLIEMQSDATPGTLIANAVTSGIDPLTAEEVVMTAEEYASAYPALPTTYQQLRAAAYPPASDYLDGIVRGDAGQVQAYIAACLAVKAKYPKP